MKQHITPEQLSELGLAASARLNQWWRSRQTENRPPFPLLSIGDMIELLNDHHFAVRCDQWINDGSGHSLQGTGPWRVGLDWFPRLDMYRLVVEKQELCDALWEAVKEVLGA